MKLLCKMGFHKLKYNGEGFQRKCKRCGATFRACYFQWRKDGYPTWVKQNTK